LVGILFRIETSHAITQDINHFYVVRNDTLAILKSYRR